jgi:hypothetical protein
MFFFFGFFIVTNWPLFSRLGRLRWQKSSENIIHMAICLYI